MSVPVACPTSANRVLVPSFLVLLGLSIAVAAAAETQIADEFQALAPGLEYRHEVRANGPLSIHVLRIDRVKHRWDLQAGLGQGTVRGLEPLDGIVSRMASTVQKTPLAAINGDFFVITQSPYQGDPRGIHIANGELVSTPTGTSFWISATGDLKIGRVTSKLRAVWPDGKTEMPVGLNEARLDSEAVLFTPILATRPGTASKQRPGTQTHRGKEFILECSEGQPGLPLAVGKNYHLRVRDIQEGGDAPLSPDRIVLSVGPKRTPRLPPVQLGEVIQVLVETEPDLRGVKTALGCGRILVEGGQLPDLGSPNQPRHPRSMIGFNGRYLFFIVVDGRQPRLSIGMTYPEMAALVKQYGCTHAVELDGGGSSTLWAMGKILNSPSDGRPRPVASALILLRSATAMP